jgi:hypothetical protein
MDMLDIGADRLNYSLFWILLNRAPFRVFFLRPHTQNLNYLTINYNGKYLKYPTKTF